MRRDQTRYRRSYVAAGIIALFGSTVVMATSAHNVFGNAVKLTEAYATRRQSAAQPAAETAAEPEPTPAERADAKAVVISLGYEFTKDGFFQAISDRNLQAVNLFLVAGMSANEENGQHRRALNHAVLGCAPDSYAAAPIIILLIKAKAEIDTKDPDNKTTPLVGAVQSCTVDVINALIKAGSDLTAKSAGGMTALEMADAFQRHAISDALRAAGAK